MARESKRKRDDRRFGRPERLADMAHEVEWFPPANGLSWSGGPKSAERSLWEAKARWLAAGVASSPVIEASNVAELVFCDPKQGFTWTDLPSIMPPFDRLLVEYAPPPRPCSPFLPSDGTLPQRVGVLVCSLTPEQFCEKWMSEEMSVNWSRVDRVLWAHVFTLRDRGLVGPIDQNFIALDGLGQIEGHPAHYLNWEDLYEDQSRVPGTREYLFTILYPALLALAFLNCKNTSLEAIEPNTQLNRERQKVGRKPFVRYHTINIEPMKRVLRAEGLVEVNGLRKALHICRGHFATYTPDKGFLGRKIDKPLTVWRPSHVRGSARAGVVVSDYKVNAPRPEAT